MDNLMDRLLIIAHKSASQDNNEQYTVYVASVGTISRNESKIPFRVDREFLVGT
jgi:hypothetical protein